MRNMELVSKFFIRIFSFGNFGLPFKMFCLFRNFFRLVEAKLSDHLHPDRNLWNPWVYSKQPMYRLGICVRRTQS